MESSAQYLKALLNEGPLKGLKPGISRGLNKGSVLTEAEDKVSIGVQPRVLRVHALKNVPARTQIKERWKDEFDGGVWLST